MRIQYPLLKRHFYRFYRAARRLGRTEATCSPACYQTWIALCATVITSRRPAVGSLFRTLPPGFAAYCKWRSSHASITSSRASGKGQKRHEVCKSNIKLSGRVNLVWKGIPHACINELIVDLSPKTGDVARAVLRMPAAYTALHYIALAPELQMEWARTDLHDLAIDLFLSRALKLKDFEPLPETLPADQQPELLAPALNVGTVDGLNLPAAAELGCKVGLQLLQG